MHAGKIDNALLLSIASGLFGFRSGRVQRWSSRFQLGSFAGEANLRRWIGGGRYFGHNATPEQVQSFGKGPNACIFIGSSWSSSGAVFVCLPRASGPLWVNALLSIPLVRVPGLMARPVQAGEVATGDLKFTGFNFPSKTGVDKKTSHGPAAVTR
jgi:hypothetical protein